MVYIANERGDATNRTCVLCVGNQDAVAALVMGSSSPDLAGVLVNLFWNVAARDNTRWRIEYVSAKSNLADYPSRQCAMPNEAACRPAQGLMPSEFREACMSWETLRREAIHVQNKMGI